MKQKLSQFIALVGLVWMASMPVSAQDDAVDDTRGAIEFIENLAAETIAVWSDSKLNEDERYTAFRAIFENATDINLLARGMLGRHFASASSQERTAYMEAMSDYIVAEFDKRMQQVGFEKLNVIGTKPASGRNGHVFVRTEVQREQGQPILADWRVRKKDGKFQIVNLEFEGINLMLTNRDVFGAKVKDVGLSGLIEWLKEQSVRSE